MPGVTLRGESSLGSYTGKVSRKGDAPSILGGRYWDVGLDDDSVHCELEGRREKVAMFMHREAVMIPIIGGGHYYMPTGRFQQMQIEHFRDMFIWYLDQFDEDPTEQQVIRPLEDHMMLLRFSRRTQLRI
ncbi:hypothetical protein FNV43_RR00465 [Rhamnella rubrinervis]|uniref:Uncharacterized protein n=1 Tax=Rhamnella rubrinervis TaxID=2594499 RepID=A0A8K0HPL5_9ROSA|nr:hypothetical protein FNV43_RR00465 [Rhamnella rubrinervis]